MCVCVCMCLNIHVCVCTCVFVCVCVCVLEHTCVCMYVCVCIHLGFFIYYYYILSYVRRGLCDPPFFFFGVRCAQYKVHAQCSFAALAPHMPCMLLVLKHNH